MKEVFKTNSVGRWAKNNPALVRPMIAASAVLLFYVFSVLFRVIQSAPYVDAGLVVSALLWITTTMFWGIMVYRSFNRPAFLWLVPFLLLVTLGLPGFGSGDTAPALLTSFISVLLLYLFYTLPKDTILHKSLLPGVLAGLALQADYTMFSLLLPVVVVILLYSKEKRVLKFLVFAATTGATLILTIPLSFFLFIPFNIPEISRGSCTAPVFLLPVLGFLLLGGPGLAYWFRKNWKEVAVLASFPLLYPFFPGLRGVNSFPAAAVIGIVFAAVGLHIIYGYLRDRLVKWKMPRQLAVASAALLPFVFFVILFLVGSPLELLQQDPDTRTRAIQVIKNTVKKGTALVVPYELEMNAAALEEDYLIHFAKFEDIGQKELAQLAVFLDNPYFLTPYFDYFALDKAVPEEKLARLNDISKWIDQGVMLDGRHIMLNTYHPLSRGNPLMVLGQLKKARFREPGVYEEVVWNRGEGIAEQQVSPYLITRGKREAFRLDLRKTAPWGGYVLTAGSTQRSEKEPNVISLLYEYNKSGFTNAIPVGRTVYFIVNAAVSRELLNRENYIFIQDLAKGWDKQRIHFNSAGWRTYILEKRVQPGITRLILGIRFASSRPGEEIKIRYVKIFVQ